MRFFAGVISCERILGDIKNIHRSSFGKYLQFEYPIDGTVYYSVFDVQACICHDLVEGKKKFQKEFYSVHSYIANRHGQGKKTASGKPKQWSCKSLIRVFGMKLTEWEKLGKKFLFL